MYSEKDHIQAKKGRTASLVIAGAMLIWIGMQWFGRLLSLFKFGVRAAMQIKAK
jgi:hypothetical protein